MYQTKLLRQPKEESYYQINNQLQNNGFQSCGITAFLQLRQMNLKKPKKFIGKVYKLNWSNALLFKIRKYVSFKTLASIYFAIFASYLFYCSLVWAQNCRTIQQILILHEKMVVRIINFQPRNFHNGPLFKRSSVLQF